MIRSFDYTIEATDILTSEICNGNLYYDDAKNQFFIRLAKDILGRNGPTPYTLKPFKKKDYVPVQLPPKALEYAYKAMEREDERNEEANAMEMSPRQRQIAKAKRAIDESV